MFWTIIIIGGFVLGVTLIDSDRKWVKAIGNIIGGGFGAIMVILAYAGIGLIILLLVIAVISYIGKLF